MLYVVMDECHRPLFICQTKTEAEEMVMELIFERAFELFNFCINKLNASLESALFSARHCYGSYYFVEIPLI